MFDLAAIRNDYQQSDERIYFNAGLVGFPAESVWEKTQNFMKIGQNSIEDHIIELSGYLMENLEMRGHRLQSAKKRERRSGIVNFVPRKTGSDFQ